MRLNTFIEETIEEFRKRLCRALEGLTETELSWQPDPEVNSIAFIVWHIVRVEDRWTHWFAQGVDDVWVREGWHQKFGLPERDTGIGYTAEQVGEFPALGGEDLKSYFEDVRVDTLGFLRDLSSADLELVPGRAPFRDHPGPVASFGTPFSIGRMYRQLIGEHNQHLGQVALLRGMQRGMDG